jgi:hypothetical protein
VALEDDKLSAAEGLVRSAATEFQSLGLADEDLPALDVLIQCLIAEKKFSEAERQLQRAVKLNSTDLAASTSLRITNARLLARQNGLTASVTKLDQLTEEMKKKNLLYYELLSRLARAESQALRGANAENQPDLDTLCGDADRAGFHLIAQKASKLR